MVDFSIISGDIMKNVLDRMSEKTDLIFTLVMMTIIFVISAIVGYIIGRIISVFVRKILTTERMKEKLIKYGAISSDLWKSVVGFISAYTTLLITAFIVTGTFDLLDEHVLDPVFNVVWNIFLFLIFAIIGYMVGGVVYKVVKDTLVSMNLEDELKRYKVADSFGGIQISTILAIIAKWYVFVIVVTFIISEITGIQYSVAGDTATQYVVADKNFPLYRIMDLLYNYIPNAILGFLVLGTALMFSNFVGNKVRYYKLVFSDTIALGVEIAIIFFGIVLALPKFGITNIQVLEYSFLILMAGISLGLAIAIGLGLRESVSHMVKKYEKKIK